MSNRLGSVTTSPFPVPSPSGYALGMYTQHYKNAFVLIKSGLNKSLQLYSNTHSYNLPGFSPDSVSYQAIIKIGYDSML